MPLGDSTALATFRPWMAGKLATDPQRFSPVFGPATRGSWLLAGPARPAGAPEYATVEDFLAPPTKEHRNPPDEPARRPTGRDDEAGR